MLFTYAFILFVVSVVCNATTCPTCVVDQGYWATHGPDGPAPYDSTFDKVTTTLCGYSYSAVLKNTLCSTFANQFWCNDARQLAAIELNLLQSDCDYASALSCNSSLLVTYLAARIALCSGSPLTYTNHGYTPILTAYNEGNITNCPCMCGTAGCDTTPTDPEPTCKFECHCDLAHHLPGDHTCHPFCTLGQGWWKNHPEAWTPSDWSICGIPYLTVWDMQSSPEINKWLNLAHQLMAANINVDNSPSLSCIPPEILLSIAQSNQILTTHCNMSITDVATAQYAVTNKTLLDAFNSGEIGNGPCINGPGSGSEISICNEAMDTPHCLNCVPSLDCCPAIPQTLPINTIGCTLSPTYWNHHHENWPLSKTLTLCGIGWPTVLQTMMADVWNNLAQQLIATRLNVAGGSFVPADILQAIADATFLIESYCGIVIDTMHPLYAQFIGNTTLLATYNEGRLGVPYCGAKAYIDNMCAPVCSPLPPQMCYGGCTNTMEYMMSHELQWPVQYIGAATCNVSWIAWYDTVPKSGDAEVILWHSYMTAVLNVAYGACATHDVLVAIQNAHDMLYTCNASLFAKSTTTRNTAVSLASFLDAYSGGSVGPGSCDFVQTAHNTRNARDARSVSAYEAVLDRMVAFELIVRGLYAPSESNTNKALKRVEEKLDATYALIDGFQCDSDSVEQKLQQLSSYLSLISTADVQADMLVLFDEISALITNSTTTQCKPKYAKVTRDLSISILSIVGTMFLILLIYLGYKIFCAPTVVLRARA